MIVFTYRAGNSVSNIGQMTKEGLDRPAYIIDWSDGLPTGLTINTVATVALDATGATVTSNCINTTVNTTAQTLVSMLTCGASTGTAAAPDGARFRLRTTATLTTTTDVLIYDVFVYVSSKAYLPA